MELNPRVKFAIAAIGIFVCYFYFSILIEQITRKNKYIDENGKEEQFTYSLTLVLTQVLCYTIFAKGKRVTDPQKNFKRQIGIS